jgi:uncharacterized protein (TIGR03067 family)
MKKLLLVFALGSLVTFGGFSASCEDRTAIDSGIQGTWIPYRIFQWGKKIPNEVLEVDRLVISGDQLYHIVDTDCTSFTLSFAGKEHPTWVDLIYRGSRSIGGGKAIFLLEKDHLTISVNHAENGARPQDFAAVANCDVFYLRRAVGTDEQMHRLDKHVNRMIKYGRVGESLVTLALAFHSHGEKFGYFPAAAITDKNGAPTLSWRVALLPFLGQQQLFDQFRLDEPWDSEVNRRLIAKMPRVYSLTHEPAAPFETHFQVFVGPGTPFEQGKRLSMRAVEDASYPEKKILVVEARNAVPWTKPSDLSYDPKGPLPPLGRIDPGEGFNILPFKFTRQFIRATFNPKKLRPAIEWNNREEFKWDDLYDML